MTKGRGGTVIQKGGTRESQVVVRAENGLVQGWLDNVLGNVMYTFRVHERPVHAVKPMWCGSGRAGG